MWCLRSSSNEDGSNPPALAETQASIAEHLVLHGKFFQRLYEAALHDDWPQVSGPGDHDGNHGGEEDPEGKHKKSRWSWSTSAVANDENVEEKKRRIQKIVTEIYGN